MFKRKPTKKKLTKGETKIAESLLESRNTVFSREFAHFIDFVGTVSEERGLEDYQALSLKISEAIEGEKISDIIMALSFNLSIVMADEENLKHLKDISNIKSKEDTNNYIQ